MSKQLIISIASILIGGAVLGGIVYIKSGDNKEVCPLDTMVCPDGSTVPRSGPNCEFGVCKTTPAAMNTIVDQSQTEQAQEQSATTTLRNDPAQPPLVPAPKAKPQQDASLFSAIIQTVTTKVSSVFSSTNNQPSVTPKTETPSTTTTGRAETVAPQTSTLNEKRLAVVNETIVDQAGKTIASIPPSSSSETVTASWETHTVNAIEVGSTTPVVDGVPVVGATGKYYVSENSFGSIENCEFSNKIFILDVLAKTKTLLYEENASTLSKDDLRACNSEIYLLATEDEKLIIKYHTINTNMICESTWSEPDKTWYLDVTNLAASMRRYYISNERYSQAESAETSCRAALPQATSTQ